MADGSIPLDPIEPTVIGPGLAAVSLEAPVSDSRTTETAHTLGVTRRVDVDAD